MTLRGYAVLTPCNMKDVSTRALAKPAKPTRLTVLRSKELEKLPWLLHGFSTRLGGFSRAYGGSALNLGFTKDDPRKTVERNRAAFLQELGACMKRKGSIQCWPLVTLRQIHSDVIHYVGREPDHPLTGDALVTDTPGLLLAVQTADCLPVMLVDTKRRAIGVFHAGWRGTVKRIVEKGVGQMVRHFGSQPSNLKAVIGPGVGGCCYTVGDEVRDKFLSQFAYGATLFREVKESDPVREKYPLLFLTARAPGHSELPKNIFLDLVEANRQQLLAAGLSKRSIAVLPLCTNCRPDLLFSYRREKGKTGRMLAALGLRP